MRVDGYVERDEGRLRRACRGLRRWWGIQRWVACSAWRKCRSRRGAVGSGRRVRRSRRIRRRSRRIGYAQSRHSEVSSRSKGVSSPDVTRYDPTLRRGPSSVRLLQRPALQRTRLFWSCSPHIPRPWRPAAPRLGCECPHGLRERKGDIERREGARLLRGGRGRMSAVRRGAEEVGEGSHPVQRCSARSKRWIKLDKGRSSD